MFKSFRELGVALILALFAAILMYKPADWLWKKAIHNVYLGTVPAHVKARRRRKNKAAKQARKRNR